MTKAIQYEPAGCEGRKFYVRDIIENGLPEDFKQRLDVIGEEKFDGVRYQLQIRPNGSKQNYLTGRRLSVQTGFYTEKQDKLTFIRDHKFPESWTGTVLDLEVIGEGISSDVCSAIAKGKGTCIVFDVTFFKGRDFRDDAWATRRRLLESLSGDFPEWLTLSKTYQNIQTAVARITKRGGEGMVLKDPSAVYGKGWWKVVTQEFHDCVITGFKMATEKKYKEKGWIKHIELGQYVLKGSSHVLLDVGAVSSGMDEQTRAVFTRNQKELIGECVEVSCKERLPTGKFRSPVFVRLRADKGAKQCIYTPTK